MTLISKYSQSDQLPRGEACTSRRVSHVDALLQYGLVSSGQVDALTDIGRSFDIGISPHILKLLSGRNADLRDDPIAKQYIPAAEENTILPDEEGDPIGDEIYCPVRGIVHRYPDRVLLKVSSVCAVYCRYCFRKEMIGQGAEHMSADDLDDAISYVRDNPQIWEVILTGGDPFMLSARRLQNVLDRLGAIDHVQIVRIHTRIPVASPSHLSETHLSVLKGFSKAVHVVIHVNHRDEVTEEVQEKILALRTANCSVLSQSVLLNGVNDNAKTLEDLFRFLVAHHVRPYYLHHLDRAKGTSHFRVPLKRGQEIMRELQGRVSGICLPKYMLDIPGGHGKIPVHDGYVHHRDGDIYQVSDYQGCTHLYFENMPDATSSVHMQEAK